MLLENREQVLLLQIGKQRQLVLQLRDQTLARLGGAVRGRKDLVEELVGSVGWSVA
jgi:hypothetical protein